MTGAAPRARPAASVLAFVGALALGCAQSQAAAARAGAAAIRKEPTARATGGPAASARPTKKPAAMAFPALRIIPAAPRGADRACLRDLDERGIPHVSLGEVRGIRTPVVIAGPIQGVQLLPRSGRPPLMDCVLARTLDDVAPILRKLRVTALSFSGAYDYRTRADSTKLSAHAHGLAIDVHALMTASGPVDVARDYARNGRRWRDLPEGPSALRRCVGAPTRRAGRLLRNLACHLKLDDDIRVILTPDDNAAHRDHLHIESHPAPPAGGGSAGVNGGAGGNLPDALVQG
jgi:hypothetical protein